MPKVILGTRPKTFARTVAFKLLDGGDAVIPCTFKYRTKREFGQLMDRMFEEAGEAPPADGHVTMGELLSKTVDKNAEYLGEVLDSWGLDVPLTPEALQQLADELPAGVVAIMEAYRAAIVEGRPGN